MPELKSIFVIEDKSSKALEKIAKAADKTSEKVEQLASDIDSVSKATEKTTKTSSRFKSETDRIGNGFQKAEKSISGVVGKIEETDNAIGVTGKSASGLVSKFTSFTSKAMPAIYTLTSAVNAFGTAMSKIRDTINMGDDIAKTSKALHIEGTSFQELSYAMQRGGASREDFETGIKTLNRQVAALKEGSSDARKAFGMLGLDKTDIEGKSLEETLYSISNALHSMSNIEDADKAMQSLFGRGGYKVTSAFAVGGSALDQLREEARATGSIMNDAQLSIAESGADALLNSQLRIQGIWNNISKTALPSVVSSMNKIGDLYDKHQDSINKIAGTFGKIIEFVTNGASKIVDLASTILMPIIDKLADVTSNFVDNMNSISSPFSKRTGKSNKGADAIITHTDNGVKAITKSIGDVGNSLEKIGSIVDFQVTSIEQFIKMQNARNGTQTKEDYLRSQIDSALSNSRVKIAEELAKTSMSEEAWNQLGLAGQLDKFSEYYDMSTETGINDYESLKAAKDQVKQLDKTIEDQTKAYKGLSDSYGEQERKLKEVNKQLREMNDYWGGFITGSKNVERYDALSKMSKEIKSSMAETQRQYSESYFKAMEAEEQRDNFLVNIASAESEIAKYGAETAKNTRSMHINKDDIDYMKSMTTAEIINRYNTTSSSIIQNNNFSHPVSPTRMGQITAGGLAAAAGASRSA